MDGKPTESLSRCDREARHLRGIAVGLAKKAAAAGRDAEKRRYLLVADLLGKFADEPGDTWLVATQPKLGPSALFS